MSDVHGEKSQSWRQTFKYFDHNNDGTIDASELQAALRAIGQDRDEEEIDQMLQNVGVKPGQSVQYGQFLELLKVNDSALTEIHRSEFTQIFRTIDIDCSGYLTAAELRHFMTKINVEMDDSEMEEMVNLYDLDGNGEIHVAEFEKIIKSMGYTIVEDEVDDSQTPSAEERIPKRETAPTGKSIKLDSLDVDMREALSVFDFSESGMVHMGDLQKAADLLRPIVMDLKDPDKDPGLHWDSKRDKRGLGEHIYKANHIALIVSDVGRSSQFYSNVMGFQQIRRPNFDKHGAWFTMGNLELHLIKGTPIVHTGDDLVVNHISIETHDIDKVPACLRQLGVPFRQNVSVPGGADGGGSGTNTSNANDKIIRQYFIRDPDGYYIEMCNCAVLTDFCLGDQSELAGYDEGVRSLSLGTALVSINLMQKWGDLSRSGMQDRVNMKEEASKTDGSNRAIASLFRCVPSKVVDNEILENFKVRKSVYGDICQNETLESLEEILLLSGNNSTIANQIMSLKAECAGSKTFVPPAFYEQGETLVAPPSSTLTST